MQDAIKQWGHKIPAEEVMAIMAAADVDGDGFIDYNEFVAATLNVNQLEKEDLIYKAFQEFDEDGSNSISTEELEKVCQNCAVLSVLIACAFPQRLLCTGHIWLCAVSANVGMKSVCDECPYFLSSGHNTLSHLSVRT